MAKAWSSLVAGYRRALRAHLDCEGEEHLQHAYELGRIALSRGLGILDMSRLHQEALVSIVVLIGEPVATVRRTKAVETFFMEALSPFEAAHRGFREAFERLQQLNTTLGHRNFELATINARLKHESEEREKTRVELVKSERQLAEAQRLAGLGSFEWDLRGGRVRWSAGLFRIYGLDTEKGPATFADHLARVHPEDRKRARSCIQAAIRDRVAYAFDKRIVRADGDVRILHSQGEVIADGRGRGRTLRLVGFCQDITERRQAEEMWRRYEAIVNTARDFLTLIDPRYRHEAVNDAYCRAHGLAREQIIGRELSGLWDRKIFRSVLKRHLDLCFAGQDVHYQSWFELGALGRRFYDVNHYPHRRDGVVTHAIVVARDITEQKQAQDALQESKEHHVRLFRQAQRMEENLRLLSHQVVSAQEEERKHISRELHDEVGQTLTAVNVSIAVLRKHAGGDRKLWGKVASAQKLLEQSLETVHRFARELRPPMLDQLGLGAALRAYVKAFGERTGIRTVLKPGAALDDLDGRQAIVLYRVTQESLTNVFKHARATQVEIRFPRLAGGISMEIADDGRAFRVNETLERKGRKRLGLLGMEERVRLVGGTFSIDSLPGRGTTVRVCIPFRPGQQVAENTPADSGGLNDPKFRIS